MPRLPLSVQRTGIIYVLALFLLFFTIRTFTFESESANGDHLSTTPASKTAVTDTSNPVESGNSKMTGERNSVPRFDNIAFIIRTGAKGTDAKLKAQMGSFLKDFKNLLVVADYDDEVLGHRVHNILDGLFERTKARIKNPDNIKPLGNQTKAVDGKNWKGDAFKVIPGLLLAYEIFPSVDWYITIDDAAFLFMGPLLKQLERFNPSEVHYLGLPFGVPKGACGETNPPKFGHSGTGIYLSKAAMKVLGKVGDGCVLKYQDCWGGDVTLSLCLRDAGVKLSEPKSNLNGLYGDPPLGDFNYDMDACNEPSAFCHLTKEQIQMFQSLRQQPERVTMGDIYQKFKGGFNLTDFVQPNVDISGTFYHHNKNQNYIDCQKQCINDPKCVAWVGEANKVCWLKKAPGKVKSRNGWAGGHIGNRYRCEEKEKGKKA